jgi:hypothetical protein
MVKVDEPLGLRAVTQIRCNPKANRIGGTRGEWREAGNRRFMESSGQGEAAGSGPRLGSDPGAAKAATSDA